MCDARAGARSETCSGAIGLTRIASSLDQHGPRPLQSGDWGFSFSSCQSTTRLRLYVVHANPSTGGQLSNPVLYELKVYSCGAADAEPVPVVGSFGVVVAIIVLLAMVGFWNLRRSREI